MPRGGAKEKANKKKTPPRVALGGAIEIIIPTSQEISRSAERDQRSTALDSCRLCKGGRNFAALRAELEVWQEAVMYPVPAAFVKAGETFISFARNLKYGGSCEVWRRQ